MSGGESESECHVKNGVRMSMCIAGRLHGSTHRKFHVLEVVIAGDHSTEGSQDTNGNTDEVDIIEGTDIALENLGLLIRWESLDNSNARADSIGDVRWKAGNIGKRRPERVREDGAGDSNTDDTTTSLSESDQRGSLRDHLLVVGILGLNGEHNVLQGTATTNTKENLVSSKLGT